MTILSTLGANFVALFAVSLALPLVLGLFARLFVFTRDTEDTDGAASQSSNPSKVSQPDFQATDSSGQFTQVKILAPPKADANRGNSGNQNTGETPKPET